jgi:hypothetical protein
LGRAVLADPAGHFHIVSKDTGFESLIEHLRSRHIRAQRHDDFSTRTFSAPAKLLSVPPDDPMTRALKHLRKNPTNRPKTKEALVRHLRLLSGNAATEADAMALVEKLCQSGRLSIGDKDAVTYHDQF